MLNTAKLVQKQKCYCNYSLEKLKKKDDFVVLSSMNVIKLVTLLHFCKVLQDLLHFHIEVLLSRNGGKFSNHVICQNKSHNQDYQ